MGDVLVTTLPEAAVLVLDGEGGEGKSQITIDLASRLSRGDGMPFCPQPNREPCNILFMSAEDHLRQVIKPRLEVAGADTTRVGTIVRAEGDYPLMLPNDIGNLEHEMKTGHIKLAVVDPFLAYLGSEIDSHNDQSVRICMSRLTRLAEETGAVIILVRHFGKQKRGAKYRGIGSVAITNAARAVWAVGRNPQEPDEFVMSVSKSNLAKTPRSLTYKIEDACIGDCQVSRIVWLGETDLTADDIAAPDLANRGGVVDEAKAWLVSRLSSGPVAVNDIESEAEKAGFTKATIRRAKTAAKIISFHPPGTRAWSWKLPDEEVVERAQDPVEDPE